MLTAFAKRSMTIRSMMMSSKCILISSAAVISLSDLNLDSSESLTLQSACQFNPIFQDGFNTTGV